MLHEQQTPVIISPFLGQRQPRVLVEKLSTILMLVQSPGNNSEDFLRDLPWWVIIKILKGFSHHPSAPSTFFRHTTFDCFFELQGMKLG